MSKSKKEELFNLVAGLSALTNEARLQQMVDNVESEAESTGFNVTFTGEFRQRASVGSDVLHIPFVVMQNVDQYTDMPDGIFSGLIYEGTGLAEIVGSIREDRVNFQKQYVTLPKSVRRARSKVRAALFPEDKGKPLQNRSIVRYEGNSSDKGWTYEGKWDFSSKTADFETTGTFTMRRYSPGEIDTTGPTREEGLSSSRK